MSEPDRTPDGVLAALRAFIAARDWERYHTPKNLAMAVAAEAGELCQVLRWVSVTEEISDVMRSAVLSELADVAIFAFHLADALEVDLLTLVAAKVAENETRFPVTRGGQ